MPVRSARAVWKGDLKGGRGTVGLGSGMFEGAYSFPSRFEEGDGTNPEELIGAAHAGCFSMQFANLLAQAGFEPASVETDAEVHLSMEGGPHVAKIVLNCRAEVPGIGDGRFQEIAQEAKTGCPISKALASVPLELDARLA
ncbi:MAG: OsmC family protein [Trueperaceae bacterium]|nr:OsmC family protein [Trueperaceae bacterium]